MTTPRKLLSLTLGVVMAATSLAVLPDAPKASAACAAQPTTYGRSTATVNVPTAGTYRVWSRIKVPSTSANSYTLEVDGTVCGITVGDHTALPVNTWAWVDFQAGVTTSKTNVTLTAGSHTFVMIGREADVQLDRVILTADTACVPTGLGENCANPPDKTAPTTAITSPANNAVLTGTATTVSATAADDVAVSKVEFFMDNTLVTTDTTSPYSASINPSTMTAGNHTLYTKAYDTAATPNVGTSTVVNVTVRDAAAPTISAIASGSITQTGATITWTTSEASDTQVEYGTTTTYGSSTTLNSTMSTNHSAAITGLTANTTYNYRVKSKDAAGNLATSANQTFRTLAATTDTTAPTVNMTAPAAGTVSGTVTLSASASDTGGVAGVQFKVNGQNQGTEDTTSPYSTTWNTTGLAAGTYSLTATARDTAGNSRTSTAVSVTIQGSTTFRNEDINQDGSVNIQDFSLLAAKFGQSGANLGRADINGDGVVNIQDFSLLASKFGQ